MLSPYASSLAVSDCGASSTLHRPYISPDQAPQWMLLRHPFSGVISYADFQC